MGTQNEMISLVRRVIALSFAVVALVLAIRVTPASAAPCREVFIDYYQEPELINWCGYKYNTCDHVYTDTSACSSTSYFTSETGACCGSGSSNCDCS